jgi:hypothetical protein
MAEHDRYGQAVPADVNHLPELVLDLSEGRLLEGLGKTDMPVHMLPVIAFDLADGEADTRSRH